MIREFMHRHRAGSPIFAPVRSWKPSLEALEEREVLSGFYTGPSTVRPIQTSAGLYTFSISGPGLLNVKHVAHGQFALNLLGTTSASTVSETLTLPRFHKTGGTIPLASIHVVSGSIGSIDLPDATLNGSLSSLSGSLTTLDLGALGNTAQANIGGSITNLTLGSVGTSTQVQIGGTVTSLSLGDLNLGATGLFSVGGIGQAASISSMELTGGKFEVAGDVDGPINFGSISVSNGGVFSVGRDVTGTITVGSNVELSTNGLISIGRNLAGLTVQGNLVVDASGGEVLIGGTLTNLTVDGTLQGQGNAHIDLSVGLDVTSFNVLGGSPGQGGVEHANIAIGKDIVALDIARGIFNSELTAGVLIDGGATAPTGGNIGPDGIVAVYNSEILAGEEINNVTIDGNVDSTYVFNSNSTGYPTRIVAGEDRSGNFNSAGLIDNFQITGSMIDSVLAASVAPSGGNGKLPNLAYGVAPPVRSTTPGDGGYNTYDAPFGTIAGGTVGTPIYYQNYSELSYYNEETNGVTHYNTSIDPTIDDFILPGAINPSFASPPLSSSALENGTTTTTTSGGSQTNMTISSAQQALPLPTKSTVLGGVISTVHGDNQDYAGIFAADTRGVFVGTLPS